MVEERTRCLYESPAGIIQVDVYSFKRSISPWQLFTNQRSPQKEISLRSGTICCALHPLLTKQSNTNDWLSRPINKVALLTKRYLNGIHQITENDQFCLYRAIVFVHLPNLYNACSIAPRFLIHQGVPSSLDGMTTLANEKIVDLATDTAVYQDLQVLDSVITLLQHHFHLCGSIYLVIKTDSDVTKEAASPPTDQNNTEAASTWIKKTPMSVTEFLEEELLPRTDKLYRTMVQHHQQLLSKMEDKGRNGKGLSFLPSLDAFTPFADKARSEGKIQYEGDWDRDRDALISVWRVVEDLDVKWTKIEDAGGYWIKTDVLDLYPWEAMEFV